MNTNIEFIRTIVTCFVSSQRLWRTVLLVSQRRLTTQTGRAERNKKHVEFDEKCNLFDPYLRSIG